MSTTEARTLAETGFNLSWARDVIARGGAW